MRNENGPPENVAELAFLEYKKQLFTLLDLMCLCARYDTHIQYEKAMQDTSTLNQSPDISTAAKTLFPDTTTFAIRTRTKQVQDKRGRKFELYRWTLWGNPRLAAVCEAPQMEAQALVESEWLCTIFMAARSLESVMTTTMLDGLEGKPVLATLPISIAALPVYEERCSCCMLQRKTPESCSIAE